MKRTKKPLNLKYHAPNYMSQPMTLRGFVALSGKAGRKSTKRRRNKNG